MNIYGRVLEAFGEIKQAILRAMLRQKMLKDYHRI